MILRGPFHEIPSMTSPMFDPRPPLHHNVTSPDLVGFRQNGSLLSISQSLEPHMERAESKELVEALHERLSEMYRDVSFPFALSDNPNYVQRVSFDTINIQYADDPDSDHYYHSPRRMLDNGDFLGDFLPRGRGRERDSGLHSPSASPNRMLSPMRGMDVTAFFARNQIAYPTTPIITRRGCTFSRLHKDFENLYLGKLARRGLHPVLPRRVILVYISGRKHTWVALDWVLRSFLEQGDTVIVVAAINHGLGRAAGKFSNYQSPQRYPAKTARVRLRQRMRPEFIKTIAADVMAYCLNVVNPDVIAKITVEISEGKTKDVLKDMYRLYEPNIVATGSKTNVRNSAPLKSWNSLRLSDRLVKNFPLPVLVVPAQNMAPFERKLRRAVLKEHGCPMSVLASTSLEADSRVDKSDSQNDSEPGSLSSLPHKPEKCRRSSATPSETDMRSLSGESLHSESSDAGSMSSTESYNSYEEIADLYEDYKNSVHTTLHQLSKAKIDLHYFSNFAKAISDKSLQFCEDLSGVNPNFKGQGAVLARAITGSNSFGAVPYKTKSMLAPVEPIEPKKSPTGAISYEELKRNLRMSAQKKQQEGFPLISVLLPSPGVSPVASSMSPTASEIPKLLTLKFLEGEKPSRLKLRGHLKKYLSHDESASRRMDLEPSKSHPEIRGMETVVPDAEKKKKKKRFWKLF